MIKKEEIYENIRLLQMDQQDDSISLLTELAQYAISNNLAKEGYKEAILEREKNFPTGLKAVTGIAIPHADQQFTLEESVVIALLDKPCIFQEMASNRNIDVSVVFMLILNNNKQVEALSRLVKIIQSEQHMKSLYQQGSCKEMFDNFGKYLR